MNHFETATRLKLRFDSAKGKLTTEDLWDLPMTTGAVNLNDIAKQLHAELNKSKFSLTKTEKKDLITEIKFDIVKWVFDVRTEELAEAADAKERAEKRQLLVDAIADKEVEELVGDKSSKELRKELKKLNK